MRVYAHIAMLCKCAEAMRQTVMSALLVLSSNVLSFVVVACFFPVCLRHIVNTVCVVKCKDTSILYCFLTVNWI